MILRFPLPRSPVSIVWDRALKMFKNRMVLGGEGQRKGGTPHEFKRQGGSKMKTRNKMLKTEAKAKGFSINLGQSKNTKVFVPIRIYTDPLTKVLLIMQFASRLTSWLGSSPIWHEPITHTLRHDFFREGAKPLT